MLADFLALVVSHFETPILQPERLVVLVSLSPATNPNLVPLRLFLHEQRTTNAQIQAAAEQACRVVEAPPLVPLVVSLVVCIRDLDPASAAASCDLVTEVFYHACRCFAHPKIGGKFPAVVAYLTPLVVRLSRRCSAPDLRLAHVKSLLAQVFSHCVMEIKKELNRNASYTLDPVEHPNDKKNLVVFVVCQLCRVYFAMGLPQLCGNLFSNLEAAAKVEWDAFPMGQQVEFRYWRGRYRVGTKQVLGAIDDLQWGYEHCRSADAAHQQRFLNYLIPCCLAAGRLPREAVIPPALLFYAEAVRHIQNGNVGGYVQWLERYAAVLELFGVAVLLQNALMPTFERLVRLVWQARGEVLQIPYAAIGAGLQLAGGDVVQVWNDAAVENLMVSLIAGGSIRGHVYPGMRLVNVAREGVFRGAGYPA